MFKASKSQSQGREGWCVLFHHPVRRDARGKPRRVRRGLKTKDETKADALVSQVNALLENNSYWNPAARERALREFDPLVVDIFFDDMEPNSEDPWGARETAIALPGHQDGFVRVRLLGSTGAGKTTLVRQLIGSDPQRERFPSTSTAKTTIFDTEIVVRDGAYAAVVAFLSRDRTRNLVEECMVAAVTAAAEGAKPEVVTRRLLEHSEQRFRLSYMLGGLGQPTSAAAVIEDVDEERDSDVTGQAAEVSDDERRSLDARLHGYLGRVRAVSESVRERLAAQFDLALETMKASDRDVVLELMEDELRDDDEAQSVVDDIVEDLESRFEFLKEGTLERDRSGWPTRWYLEETDRAAFIRAVNRFSSNYAPNFGRLLAPLVHGLRVAGPFRPEWWTGNEAPRLVLMDGEGIGHTPDSATSVPTSVTRRYDQADAILLVDSATQPMAAGPMAVLRSIATSGHEAKLIVAFTHFDQVTGDNLPSDAARRDHVLASLESAIGGIEETVGVALARSIRRGVQGRVFYLGGIDERLTPQRRGTRSQLKALCDCFHGMIAPTAPVTAMPVYDLGNLVIGATVAARKFQDAWDVRLVEEHWTRLKALARRLGYLHEDEYDTLKPVADLIRFLSEQMSSYIASPRGWEPAKPDEEAVSAAIGHVAREFFTRLHTLVPDRLWLKKLPDWQTAYDERGKGSGYRRTRNLRAIYNAAAPIPGAVPEPEATDFLDALRTTFKEAAIAAGARVL